MNQKFKAFAMSAAVSLITICLCLAAGEAFLRIKNSDMKNYDIEMWKYSRDLKIASANPALGHVHRPNQSAVLQSVEVRTNSLGLRGPAVMDKGQIDRRILVLGSSITLGWGVAEAETMEGRLETILAEPDHKVEVLNAGVGNYNAPRYTALFFDTLKDLNPDDIIVHYFLRDAELLEPGGGNLVLRNSQLAVTLWIAFNRLFQPSRGKDGLVKHYEGIYRSDAPGFKAASNALADLAAYAKKHNKRLYLAITPDVHFLEDYPFAKIHGQVATLATSLGYKVVDFLPAMKGMTPSDIWAMAGDPHPNALGHEIMARVLAKTLSLKNAE